MDFTRIPVKMLNPEKAKVDMTPVMVRLRELHDLAKRYQSGTPAKLDFAPLIKKLKEAESIGMNLKRKADSGKI